MDVGQPDAAKCRAKQQDGAWPGLLLLGLGLLSKRSPGPQQPHPPRLNPVMPSGVHFPFHEVSTLPGWAFEPVHGNGGCALF